MLIEARVLLFPAVVCALVSKCQIYVGIPQEPPHDFGTSCGSEKAPCPTIQQGINEARDRNASVLCLDSQKSQYDKDCREEGLVIDRSLTIRSLDISPAVIDCLGKRRLFVFTPTLPNSTIRLENLAILNTHSVQGGSALYASKGTVTVEQCRFENNTSLMPHTSSQSGGGAILVEHTTSATISRSNFTNCAAPTGVGGGILVKMGNLKSADSATIQLHVINSKFYKCLSGIGGGGLAVIFEQSASDVDLVFNHTDVTHSAVQNAFGHAVRGGAIYISWGTGLSEDLNFNDCTISFTNCRFTNSKLKVLQKSGEFIHPVDASGGGVSIEFLGRITKVRTSFKSCKLSNNELTLSSSSPNVTFQAKGGGLYIDSSQYPTNRSNISFENCDFSSNTLAIKGQGGQCFGGGVSVLFSRVTESAISIHSCRMSQNTLTITGRGVMKGIGGGMSVQVVGTAFDRRNLRQVPLMTHLQNVIASHNQVIIRGRGKGRAQGGGIHVQYSGIATMTTTVKDSNFTNNSVDAVFMGGATGGDANGFGGGMFLQTFGPTIWTIVGTAISGNVANTQGGGIWTEQIQNNLPTNLNMRIDPAKTIDGHICTAASADKFRQWGVASQIVILSSVVVGNRAGELIVTPSLKASNTMAVSNSNEDCFGGGIHARDLSVILRNTKVAANFASVGGGGIHLGPGSGCLQTYGKTYIGKNLAQASGAAVYSSSGGKLQFFDGTVVDIGSTHVPGITVLEGGNISIGDLLSPPAPSILQCARGEQMVYNLTVYRSTFSDWTIDCARFNNATMTMRNMSFVNEDCKNLSINPSCQHPECRSFYSCQNLPLFPQMLLSTGTVSCLPCPNGLYTLGRGMRQNGTVNQVRCTLCPFGADCSNGGADFRVKTGFWAEQINTSQGVSVARVLQCPSGYCCDQGKNSCPWRGHDSTCQGHRDPSVPFCGQCLPKWSHSIDSNNCVADKNCGKVLGFVLWQIAYYVAFVLYALYESRYPPLIKFLWRRLRPAKYNSGGVSAVVFFLQLVAYAVPRSYHVLVTQVSKWLGDIVGAEHVPSLSGTCIYKGMRAEMKWMWRLFNPIMLLLTLALVSFIHSLCLSFRTREEDATLGAITNHSIRSVSTSTATSKLGSSSNNHSDSAPSVHVPMESSVTQSLLVPEEFWTTDSHHSQDKEEVRQSLIRASACLLLFSFASLTVNTLRLLHCVEVGAGIRVLFYAGIHRCSGLDYWAMCVLLGIILAIPSLFVLLAIVRELPCPWSIRQWSRKCSMPDRPILQALRRYACEPFSVRHWYWTPLLALQRAVTVMWSTFTGDPAQAAVGVSLISLFFLVWHVFSRPYKKDSVNFLQTICLVCLTGIAICSTISSTLISTGVTAEATPLQSLIDGLNVFMFTLLLIPLLLCAYLHVRVFSYQHYLRLTEDELEEQQDTVENLSETDLSMHNLDDEEYADLSKRDLQEENEELAAELKRTQAQRDVVEKQLAAEIEQLRALLEAEKAKKK